MPEYILLLNQPKAKHDHLSPDEIQSLIAKYSAWRDSLIKRNLLRGGNKLVHTTSRTLRTENGKVLVTEGPYSESQEILGGYFIIEAPNYDEAVAISRTCPHLVDGQSIELRQIDITPPPSQQ